MFTDQRTRIRVHVFAFAFLGIALLLTFLSPAVSADEWNKKTILTFSAPVEIPGKVLPAGTYVFKLLDSPANRHVVQVFDKDEKQLLATILAVPDYRLKPTGETTLYFEERPAGQPEALRAWFYPGDNFGQQFVYPNTRATQLAKQSKHNVLSMSNEMANNKAQAGASSKSAEIMEFEKTEVAGVDPSGRKVRIEEVVLAKPQTAEK
jgi:hypothetical protein